MARLNIATFFTCIVAISSVCSAEQKTDVDTSTKIVRQKFVAVKKDAGILISTSHKLIVKRGADILIVTLSETSSTTKPSSKTFEEKATFKLTLITKGDVQQKLVESKIVYKTKSTDNDNIDLTRISGNQDLEFGDFNLTWSNSSDSKVYIYLSRGIRFARVKS